MPHPPRLKIRFPEHEHFIPRNEVPFINELPAQVQEEVKQKIQKGERDVQFRMPLDVWARMRARQFELNEDSKHILKEHNIPTNGNLVPMSEIIRKMFDVPLTLHDQDILGMVHKGKGKGRLFR